MRKENENRKNEELVENKEIKELLKKKDIKR